MAALTLALTTLGFSCSSAQQQNTLRRTATGISTAARGIDTGIDTVRAFREAGEITPTKARELAQIALDANSVMSESVEFVLSHPAIDEPGRLALSEQLTRVATSARRLSENGTLHLKNGKTKLAFELGITAGKAGINLALDELQGERLDGLPLTVDSETRAKLERAGETIRRNDQRLREAIARLSSL